ncbi:MAG: response regulator [Anaerolineae bacterium]|nr:response regulator [Anaerolineae bacterium]NIN98264.1 response regulator [Anaerolineae bacterium]NIQ81193.1 response regulator [Anaerolineae bacterium]
MNERIFIIDDEETLCYFLKESLEERGYKVIAAHTVADGLDIATKQQIDLVLLDLKLPDGDGLDVLREIRKVDSNLPVIVLTGHAAVESAVQAMKLGAYDYLEKPINLAELSSSVAQALESSSQARTTVREQEREVEFERAQALELADSAEAAPVDRFAARELAAKSRMVRQLERQLEEVVSLDSISSELLRSLELDEVMGRVMDRLLELPSVDMIAVLVGDQDRKELVLAGQRRFASHVWEGTAQRRLPTEGVLGRSLAHLPPVLPLADAGPDPWVDELGARLGDGILLLLLPLRDGDEVRGLMLVGRRGGQPFDVMQSQTLATVADRLALVVGHAVQFSSLREGIGRLLNRQGFSDSVLQGMSNGLVVVDREGKIRLVNLAGERLLGCKEEEVLDSPLEEVLGFGAEIVRDSLERELAYSGEEIVVERERGERIPLGMSISPLRGEGRKVNGAVVMLSDLRETRALEEERRKLDRLAFLGEISAVMAHEIRNPLAGMGAGIQHLQTKFEEGDERHEALGRILREGERVNRIIEDILLISRPPHLNLAPCDISEVIGEVVREWEGKAREKGVEIRQYTAAGLPLVKGDKVRLHQALSNLVSNGIEAMPGGGELTIAVTGPARPDLPDIAGREELWGDGDYVEVDIADKGVGISQEDLGRIFEPFWSAKARGTGLELAISKRIINEHGGEVEVQSQEGEGTRFIVRVPLARRGGR